MSAIQPTKTNLAFYKQASKVIGKYTSKGDTPCIKDNKKLIDLPQFRSLTPLFPSVVCIIDIVSKDYLYISNNLLSVLGYSPDEFYKDGFLKTVNLFPPLQLEIVLEKIFPMMFETFEKYSKTDRVEDLKISYCTLTNHKKGYSRWFLHQITVLMKDENDKAFILIKQVTDIHDFKNDDNIVFTIEQKDQLGVYHTVLRKSFLPDEKGHLLTEREVEVLQLMGQGYSSREIANTLYLSKHTVYNHRKNMLKKMNVKRTGDLLKKAIAAGIV